MGLHGPMLDRGADVDPAALAALVAQLTGAVETPISLRGVGRGGERAQGRLVGGSLTLVAASIGTDWEVQTRGAILLLEDHGERPYRIDRMLQQLRGSGRHRTGGFFELRRRAIPRRDVGVGDRGDRAATRHSAGYRPSLRPSTRQLPVAHGRPREHRRASG